MSRLYPPFMMAALLAFGAAALIVLSVFVSPRAGAAPVETKPPAEFVTLSGTQFVFEGRPFRVAGVNNHYLAFGSNEEIVRVLDDAKAMGANVVRTFIQPVIGSPDGVVTTIWNWKSDGESSAMGAKGRYVLSWDDKTGSMAFNDGADGLARFDFVVAEARKRGLKLIVAFMDFWGYAGGAQQVSAWYGSRDKYTFFASDPRTRRDYKAWVAHVLTRRNPLIGRDYRDEPTIMAWDLMNEPDIHPIPLLVNWVSEMSAYVKSLDPMHLVTTGRANIAEPFADLDVSTIDFGTWHGYASYEKISNDAFQELALSNCGLATEFGKPIILEEFGVPASQADRADTYRKLLHAMNDDPSCAGWVVWRLVSRQDNGNFPADVHDGFDVHNDGSTTWRALSEAAHQIDGQATRAASGR